MTVFPPHSGPRVPRSRHRLAVQVAGLFLVLATLLSATVASSGSAGAAPEDNRYQPSFVGAPYFAPGAVYTENFPDPDVVWDPETQKYYAFSTTTGGVYVPVMWSTDLVKWTARTNHAIANPNWQFHDALPDPSPAGSAWTSGDPRFPDGLWAPTVAKLSGSGSSAWVMFYALRVNDAGRHCIDYATSQTPDGPYTSPKQFFCSTTPLGVIDPDVFTDTATGKTWLMWQDQGEVGKYWSSLWMREISLTSAQSVDWAPSSTPVYLMNAGAAWENGVVENPSMVRTSDGVPTLFYSGGLWDSVGYSVGMAKCGPLQFSWTPICSRVGSGQSMSARQGMRGIGGSAVFSGADGANFIANHYWREGIEPGYPGNQRRLVSDRLHETPGGIAFSHEQGPVGIAASSGYVSVGPTRVLDTRYGFGTTSTRALESGEVFTLDLSAQTTSTTTAVTLNIAIDGAVGPGYLTAYPCGDPPVAASLNYVDAAVAGNAATVRLNPSRKLCIYVQSSTHLIVDLQGRYDSAVNAAITPVEPTRVLDTRPSNTVPAGGFVEVPIVGYAGVPSGATAVLVSVAADGAAGPGYLTAWQCGGKRPTVANVNYGTKWPAGNGAIVPLSQSGSMCVYSQHRADVIVDVFGYVSASGQRLRIASPTRVFDSRTSLGVVGAGQTVPVQVTGAGKAAAGSTAVEVNVTATDARAPGWVSVFPCSAPPARGSETAVLNLVTGQTKAAHVVVPVGVSGTSAGQICLRTQNATHLVVDLSGGYN
ncbi:unannotated protein [freshwater metagenome]|uniref:Unannotated protein n=1 Tax=freshwater metagenome TaxID=449393 RepID=A0A6J6JWH7_9ZZZZ|nr:family 43 glycosylhydrolase [Actinomycetota bacterium]MTA87605.1 family 43 glycosylhydrolase [Actinomycetota bacterium]MTB01236.1 family 43 glycosylhydrolase [Actinomycetota bacterium]